MKRLIVFGIILLICLITVCVSTMVNIMGSEKIKNKDKIKNPFKFEYLTESRYPSSVVCINNFVYYYEYSLLAPIFNKDRLPMTCEEFKGE